MLRTCAARVGAKARWHSEVASKPQFGNKVGCAHQKTLLTLALLAASALRADLGVFLAGVQDIDDFDTVNGDAVHHQIAGMGHNLARARYITNWAQVGVL